MIVRFTLLSFEVGSTGDKSKRVTSELPKVESRPPSKLVKDDLARHTTGLLLRIVKWMIP
jgi:hypothetical protein